MGGGRGYPSASVAAERKPLESVARPLAAAD